MRAGELDLTELAFPLVVRTSAPVTDEQLIRFSELNKTYKIEQNTSGEITIMTPVGGTGGTHEIYIASMLYQWAKQDGKGIAFGPNTGFRLPDQSCLAPDAAWLSISRWNALTPEQQANFPPFCPEFIIEVRSRSDPRRLIEAKMQLWLHNGAELAWLIDPIDKRVSVHRPGKAPQTLIEPEVVRGESPVGGFDLHCAELWA